MYATTTNKVDPKKETAEIQIKRQILAPMERFFLGEDADVSAMILIEIRHGVGLYHFIINRFG